MKTKNKTLALAEIVIVLFSILLVALPAIAADQTMQEVSASTITTIVSEDIDTFTLGIYGNANEDDTIDMRDTTYIKLAIFGKKPKTDLADANNDGKVSMLDVGQTKLIILGKEKELTFLDTPGESGGRLPEAVTIQKPVERIVVPGIAEAETLRSLNSADKVVGVTNSIKTEEVFFPELSKLPSVGSGEYHAEDYEAILNMNPDIYFGRPSRDKDKLPDVAVISVAVTDPIDTTRDIRKLGYIFDKREEAEEFISWHDDWMNHIKERTDRLSEDEKPKVYYWHHFRPGGSSYSGYATGRFGKAVKIAGGKRILEGVEGGHTIDPEFVISQNPDVILARPIGIAASGYDSDDPSEIATAREDILNRDELAKVTAVVEEEVYLVDYQALANAGSGAIVCVAYFAKWLQPDIFEDLNPEAIHKEYLTRFQRFDFDLDEHGIFAYPPVEVDEGLAGIPDRYKGEI